MGPIVCTESSVRNYRYSLSKIPEEHGSYLFAAGSRIIFMFPFTSHPCECLQQVLAID